VDRQHIVVAALAALRDAGALPASAVQDAVARYGIEADAAAPWLR